MEEKLLKILEECNANRIDAETAKEQALDLFNVSKHTFTSACAEVEDMAVEIDQFINQHALAKPMTYSSKLRQYLANKLNEYVG